MISVIVPVWNNAKYIRESLTSIMQQSPPQLALEILIVDDGSTDHSLNIALEVCPQAQIIKKEHKGISHTLNTGVLRSKGSFVAFLDADDTWTKKSLMSRYDRFIKNPNLDICTGFAQQFLDVEMKNRKVRIPAQPIPAYVTSGLLLKKALFKKVGLFDETLKASQGMDWFMRATDMKVNIELCEEVVLKRRIHGNNYSHEGIQQKELPLVIKRSLERRRAL